MINTMKPAAEPGNAANSRNDVLQKVLKQYERPEEKEREPVKKLGKDEFFKIMIQQIQHQDPLKPYQNEEMAAQLAQFTALEQMTNVNQNLEKLTASQQPLHHLGAANLIGKFVTVDSSRLMHTEGKYTDIKFELPVDASKVRIAVLNERGELVREMEQKDLKKGPITIPWDGKGGNNMSAKSGRYLVQVGAESELGKPVPVQTMKTEVVHGVAFDGKQTLLLTGDIKNPAKIPLAEVSKIVDRNNPNTSSLITPPNLIPPPQTSESSEIPGPLQNMQLPEELQELASQLSLPAQPQQVEPLPEESDRPVEGFVPGQSGKFVPFNVSAFRKMQQEGSAPKVESQEPAAAQSKDEIDPVNPAAKEFAQKKYLPSSAEGSTAGKWNE